MAAPDHRLALARLRRRAATVPVVATLAGSACALAPVLAPVPLLPPTGLLMLLAWRLLRPELWPAWVGLPLGLADDLVTGRPLGTGAVIWTTVLLGLEAGEDRMAWRTRGQGEAWLVAGVALGVATLGGWAAARLTGGDAPLAVTAPPLVAGILLFPLAQRVCAALDRWRLAP